MTELENVKSNPSPSDTPVAEGMDAPLSPDNHTPSPGRNDNDNVAVKEPDSRVYPESATPYVRAYVDAMRWARATDSRARLLAIIGKISVGLAVFSYLYLLFCGFTRSLPAGLGALGISALGFVGLSVARRLVDLPRPYEVYDFPFLGLPLPRDKAGSSFPSRHVFSAFLIGGMLLPYSLPTALTVMGLGLLIAACRVLLGMHFLRDVIWGGGIGLAWSLLNLIFVL